MCTDPAAETIEFLKRDVLNTLDIDDTERRHIAQALRRFGSTLRTLDRHMAQAGVDDDIIAFLRPSIATQIQQLQALGEAGHGAH